MVPETHRQPSDPRLVARPMTARRWVPTAILAAVLVAVFFINTGPIGDADYGLHLRIGQEIVQNLAPPSTDNHSYTLPNAPYPDHEWLAQVLIYLGARALGDAGMVAVKGLLVALALGLLLLSLRGPLALRLTLLVVIATLGIKHSQVRPHLFAWVMAALLVLLLDRKKYWAVPLLLLFWTNTHGSVLLAVGIAGLHFLGEAWRTKSRRPLLWAGLVALVPLLNPQGVHIYTVFFAIGGHVGFISEWQPWAPDTPFFWLVVGLATAALTGALCTRPLSPPTLVAVGVLVTLAFISRRNGVVAGIYLAPIIAGAWGPRLSQLSRLFQHAVAGAALLCLASILALRLDTGEVWVLRLDPQALPIAGVRFLRERAVPAPVLNDYDFGGTMLWAAWPDFKVFIDGRTEVYAGPVLDQYLTVSLAEPGWQTVLERYGVSSILLRPARPLTHILAAGGLGWDLVYFDDVAVLFVRDGTAPDLRRIRALSPFGRSDVDHPDQAIDEAEYLIQQNPLFLGGYKRLTLLYFHRGDFQAARRNLARYLELHPAGTEHRETQALIAALTERGAWP